MARTLGWPVRWRQKHHAVRRQERLRVRPVGEGNAQIPERGVWSLREIARVFFIPCEFIVYVFASLRLLTAVGRPVVDGDREPGVVLCLWTACEQRWVDASDVRVEGSGNVERRRRRQRRVGVAVERVQVGHIWVRERGRHAVCGVAGDAIRRDHFDRGGDSRQH